MPLVLYTAEGAASSGYQYMDTTGVSYEFPGVYLNRMVPGESFVYHRPGGYIGCGLIGPVHVSQNPGNYTCEILDFRPFESAVPLKDFEENYYEADLAAGKVNVYWAQGVRSLAWPAYQSILGAAQTDSLLGPDPFSYASPHVSKAVERFSVDLALDWLGQEFPRESVVEMPHNNPGFDILVGASHAPARYVEVKGTQSAIPRFWLTEGERQFSFAHPAEYLLIVVSGIDLTNSTNLSFQTRSGSLEQHALNLEVVQWRGVL